MANAIGIIFIAVFVAQALGTVAYLVQTGRLLRRLEVHHPEIHDSLGAPQLIANSTPKNNMLLMRWLWRREFQSLGDAATVALARNVRTLFACLAAGFVLMVVLFLVLQFHPGRSQ